jgi:hypothetical protein
VYPCPASLGPQRGGASRPFSWDRHELVRESLVSDFSAAPHHQWVSEFVYFFAENTKIPPKIKIYKIYNKSIIKYNIIALKTGILESIKYL